MKIVYVKTTDGSQYEIPEKMVSSYSHSGSVEQGARELELTLSKNDFDFKVGDTIGFQDENLDFVGQLIDCGKANKEATQTLQFADYILHLENSKDTMLVNSTPEGVAREICNKIGFLVDYIIPTGVATGKRVYERKTYYDIIRGLFDRASSTTGMVYKIGMKNAGLHIKAITEPIDYVLSDSVNLDHIEYKESIRNLVNKVVVYDDNQKKINEKTNETINTIGTFQEVADKDDDLDEILTNIQYELRVSGIGDNRCVSGELVKFKDSDTKIEGIYRITEDRHTIQNKVHKMTLRLEFVRLA